jgi:hypothetical protein
VSARVHKRLVAGCVTAAALTLCSTAWSAPPDKAQAREAYDRGLEAHKRGDHRKAAEEFALADSLAPSHVALRAAIDAAIDADDPAIGAELIERAKREPGPPSLSARVKEATAKFKGRAGRAILHCPSGSSCVAKIDDVPVEVEKPVWARTGHRNVVAQIDGGAPQTKPIDVVADQVTEVTLSKSGPNDTTASTETLATPSDAPLEMTPHRRDWKRDGLPPIYFYAGLGATVVLAGLTTAFALDASSTHGKFEDAGCTRVNASSCSSLASDGEGAQTRTNVSLVLTALVGVATAVVGVKFTDWSAPIVAAVPGGGIAGFHATF